MTDIELLPLPNSGSGFYEDNVWHDAFSKRQMEAYARANVAHATEPLKAEIERLRAVRDSFQRVGIAAQARAERLAEEIDWIKSQPEGDRMFAEIEAAAKASFHRHRTSCRGQVLTRADNYESHLVWATLEWAKRTNGAEQRAERLAEALRRQRGWWLASKGEAVSNAPGGLTRIDPGFIALCDAHVQQIDLALRDHGQEEGK